MVGGGGSRRAAAGHAGGCSPQWAHPEGGAAGAGLHFPWCPAARPRPARPCPALGGGGSSSVVPPCRRRRGRAGGRNTPTTSTASGSTAAPAAAPPRASPGEAAVGAHGGRGAVRGPWARRAVWGWVLGVRSSVGRGTRRRVGRVRAGRDAGACSPAARISAMPGTLPSRWRRTWPRWAWPRIPTRPSPSPRRSCW